MHKFRWKPSEFANLPFKEKAMTIAMIDIRIEDEEKENKKLKASRRGGRRR